MKKSELAFSAILLPLDFLMIIFAGLAAYFLRFQALSEVQPVIYQIPFRQYLNIILVAGVFWLVIFAMAGLYNVRKSRRLTAEISKIFLACSSGIMIVIVLIFFNRDLFSSRFIVLSGWALSVAFVSLGRAIIRLIQRLLYKRGIGVHGVAVIGRGRTADHIAQELREKPSLGCRVIGRYGSLDEDAMKEISRLKDNFEIDEIVQADPNLPKEDISRLIDLCNENHIIFKYAADLLGAKSFNVEVNAIAGVPVMEIKKTPLDGWGKIIKRLVDIAGATAGLLILSPFFLVVSVAVKIDSPGPVFVRLKRIGEKGRPFVLYKFRSMVDGAARLKKDLLPCNERADGPLFKMKNDPRITRFGKFIRKTSIDELPQLANVLKGQMSLVGPRPHEPEEVSRYEKDHKRLLDIRPGITGMAQISGRSDLDFKEEARLDTYYIENWSPKLDLQILAKTPWAILGDKSAC